MNMDREKQEEEVMEYLEKTFLWVRWNRDVTRKLVRRIMRRYDLVPRGE